MPDRLSPTRLAEMITDLRSRVAGITRHEHEGPVWPVDVLAALEELAERRAEHDRRMAAVWQQATEAQREADARTASTVGSSDSAPDRLGVQWRAASYCCAASIKDAPLVEMPANVPEVPANG